MSKLIFDFETDTTCPKPIPMRGDGLPGVFTLVFAGRWAECCKDGPCANATMEVEPNGTPFQNRHAIRVESAGDRDQQIRFGEIVEVNLDEDTYRVFQFQRHLRQGRCREQEA